MLNFKRFLPLIVPGRILQNESTVALDEILEPSCSLTTEPEILLLMCIQSNTNLPWVFFEGQYKRYAQIQSTVILRAGFSNYQLHCLLRQRKTIQ
jgi:hypothetical protein